METKVIFLPTAEELREFQVQMYKEDHVAVVLDENIKKPNNRKKATDNSVPYNHTTRVVRIFKEAASYKCQIQKPCVSNVTYEAYHIGEYGIIVEKEKGKAICLVQGKNFDIIEIPDASKNRIAIKSNEHWTVIEKVYSSFEKEEGIVSSMPATEKEVLQDNEKRLISDRETQDNLHSWVVCLYKKFIKKYPW